MTKQAGIFVVLAIAGLLITPANAATYRLETTVNSSFWGPALGNSMHFVFDVTYDPSAPATVTEISTFRRGTFDPTVAGSTGLSGQLSMNGQNGNLDYVTVSMFENKTKSQDSFSLGFIVDPAPFNDTPGDFLHDDDQNDGFDFFFDVNAVRLGWGGTSSLLDGVATMPADLTFLNALPFTLQVEMFGVSNFGSLFKTLSFSNVTGTWTQQAEVAAVPVPAALPLLASALAGAGIASWRRHRRTA